MRPESPVSIPGFSVLDLWSAEWQRQVYPDYFGFPVVLIPPLFCIHIYASTFDAVYSEFWQIC